MDHPDAGIVDAKPPSPPALRFPRLDGGGVAVEVCGVAEDGVVTLEFLFVGFGVVGAVAAYLLPVSQIPETEGAEAEADEAKTRTETYCRCHSSAPHEHGKGDNQRYGEMARC